MRTEESVTLEFPDDNAEREYQEYIDHLQRIERAKEEARNDYGHLSLLDGMRRIKRTGATDEVIQAYGVEYQRQGLKALVADMGLQAHCEFADEEWAKRACGSDDPRDIEAYWTRGEE